MLFEWAGECETEIPGTFVVFMFSVRISNTLKPSMTLTKYFKQDAIMTSPFYRIEMK